ncbi:hypothetical protein BegalDRAFT_2361 [Beggiatoa alba B18LD]|uniref:Lysozyme inhibitor LprI-like N-terminal domain-containing protein n=1 Tax=Beggiatoa alba B18LD TaxID=395493 RepID=I3CHX1_9GAMM|nr:lysozyme inhibitor LprI family protein [Beggiatoa alba]EIJ43214.1 hypothetical protein BegalDRAFT_2361 [Beggiatoa alba B18LD]
MKTNFLSALRYGVYALSLFSVSTFAAEGDIVIKNVWRNLDKTTNQCPEVFDYFPNGGILSFYCRAKTFLSYEDLQKLYGKNIYRQGPHANGVLNLHDKESFGYYDPEFVKWLGDTLIINTDDKMAQTHLQAMYDNYVTTLARTYYVVYKALEAQPEFLQQEKANYQALLNSKTVPDNYAEQYYDFASLNTDSSYDGNVIKGAVLFWLRRHIDDTHKPFFQNLQKLLTTYDAGFLRHDECMQAQTPSQRLSCAEYEYTEADKALNTTYQQLYDQLGADKQTRLKEAQRAWLVYRDTNAKLLIVTGAYKGIAEEDIAMLAAKKDLTESRVNELQALIMELNQQ